MPKFRRKPVVVEAFQTKYKVTISTPEGVIFAQPGAWIITGVKGEQYPCRDDIFRQLYEPVDEDAEKALEKKDVV